MTSRRTGEPRCSYRSLRSRVCTSVPYDSMVSRISTLVARADGYRRSEAAGRRHAIITGVAIGTRRVLPIPKDFVTDASLRVFIPLRHTRDLVALRTSRSARRRTRRAESRARPDPLADHGSYPEPTFRGHSEPSAYRPPLEEQQAIVRCACAAYADDRCCVSRALNVRSHLLREYRTRLIADVVTGKLDVREAAARLPEDARRDRSRLKTAQGT